MQIKSPPRAELGATLITLQRQSKTSFAADRNALDQLISWLCETHEYKAYPPRSPAEFARLWNAQRSLLVIYRSGTVLVQGQQQVAAFERLDRIAEGMQKW